MITGGVCGQKAQPLLKGKFVWRIGPYLKMTSKNGVKYLVAIRLDTIFLNLPISHKGIFFIIIIFNGGWAVIH